MFRAVVCASAAENTGETFSNVCFPRRLILQRYLCCIMLTSNVTNICFVLLEDGIAYILFHMRPLMHQWSIQLEIYG